jgi:hypothetical protein
VAASGVNLRSARSVLGLAPAEEMRARAQRLEIASQTLELAFSKSKTHLCQAAEHTIPGLDAPVARAFSPKECRNLFRHVGYVQT